MAGSRPPRGTPPSTAPHISLNAAVLGSSRELYGETQAAEQEAAVVDVVACVRLVVRVELPRRAAVVAQVVVDEGHLARHLQVLVADREANLLDEVDRLDLLRLELADAFDVLRVLDVRRRDLRREAAGLGVRGPDREGDHAGATLPDALDRRWKAMSPKMTLATFCCCSVRFGLGSLLTRSAPAFCARLAVSDAFFLGKRQARSLVRQYTEERAEARESAPHTHVCLKSNRTRQGSAASDTTEVKGARPCHESGGTLSTPYQQARRAHRHACGSFALFWPTFLARASDAVPAAAAHHGVRDEADEHLKGDEPQDDLADVLLLLRQVRAGQLVDQIGASVLRPPRSLRRLLLDAVHAALDLEGRGAALRIDARLELGHQSAIVRRRRVEVLVPLSFLPADGLEPRSSGLLALGIIGHAGHEAAAVPGRQLERTCEGGKLKRVS
eukprot:CAMPEP_0118847406 /NCGR_PEP_ID=MMETSP1162-20130426/92950_1 /TAXON_ID=33656 /ORGANISM="Phaeocystis Sp, Strain CCMP2710" /LENGTH=442 /DNA_ID=CAMNT_0006779597 /DNA_START=380 /DNA_END=1707 /DNA_ORIENTATION=+